MPELLAPAGSPEALTAAVRSGADAVYLGAGSFNARRTAGQFSGDDLTRAVRWCHERGAKVYVTLNTLVREDELPLLEEDIRMIGAARADAVLVQDFGVARVVRDMLPGMPLHASTQMAAHNRQAVEFLARQGCERVVLAREMPIEEIRRCAGLGTELEVFVHGALCVACSGQCLFSSMVGGRSGNRGRCAQPCRQRYTMDGVDGCLLSTRDLCGLEDLHALTEAGVDSLKLEGRLKRPEYVSVVTRAYRAALDSQPRKEAASELKQMFNRGGFTTGYLRGVRDTELMYRERPNHCGISVGSCERGGKIRLSSDILEQDALVLRGRGEDRPVKLSGSAGDTIPCPSAKPGDALVRLVSEAQMNEARESVHADRRKTPIRASLTAKIGQPLTLTAADVTVCGEPVQPAQNRGIDEARLRAQLSKTGNTPFTFEEITVLSDANAFVPVSALNALRREALERLSEKRLPPPYEVREPLLPVLPDTRSADTPGICVYSASAEVLARAETLGADRLIWSPDDVRPEALDLALSSLPERFELALPPVLSTDSLTALNAWASAHGDRIAGTYLCNIAHFDLRWPGTLRADYTLNCMNRHALTQLADWGIESFVPSAELNTAQLRPLIGMPRELIVHGRLPLMFLRHCPYRAVHGLSGEHAACRRCDTCRPEDRLDGRALTDKTGAAFPMKRLATPDGCIIRLYNSVPLMLLRRIRKLSKADMWRVMTDDMSELETFYPLYRAAANGETLSDIPNIESTTGHYFRGVE